MASGMCKIASEFYSFIVGVQCLFKVSNLGQDYLLGLDHGLERLLELGQFMREKRERK